MPAGPRIRANFAYGLVSDNPLTAGATAFNSAELPTLPAVVAAHAVVTLDPRRVFGEPEIVVVTTHTAAATVATITRGQYGTVARSHPQNTEWVHSPIDEDFIEILTSGTRPGNPYAGQPIFETDTNAPFLRNAANTAWANFNMYADPPACSLTHNVGQAFADAVEATQSFNTENFDSDNMHDLVNPTRITFNTPGLFLILGAVAFPANADYTGIALRLRRDGTTYISDACLGDKTDVTVANNHVQLSHINRFSVGQYVELRVAQNNTAGASRDSLSATSHPRFQALWVGR